MDANKKAFETVKENLKTTNLFDRAVVLNTDTLSFLNGTKERFDVVLLDPPYQKGLVGSALPLLSRCCNPNALVVCETDVSEDLPDSAGALQKQRVYKYGKTKLTTYRKQEETV